MARNPTQIRVRCPGCGDNLFDAPVGPELMAPIVPTRSVAVTGAGQLDQPEVLDGQGVIDVWSIPVTRTACMNCDALYAVDPDSLRQQVHDGRLNPWINLKPLKVLRPGHGRAALKGLGPRTPQAPGSHRQKSRGG